MSTRAKDRAIAALADRQHGNVTRGQLIGLGMSCAQIDHRVRIGRLHRVHHGIYSVGRPPRTALERASAAILACGPGAVLSHRSALALWDLTQWGWTIAVTTPSMRHRPGIELHRSNRLTPRDVRRRHGLRVTSPARTLLDCAPIIGAGALARAVNEGRHRKIVRPIDLADVIRRFPRHPGARFLAGLVHTPGGPTRSGWEDSFPEFCRRHGLPDPIMAAIVAGYEVDALFPREKVIVELDGWTYHSSRESFEGDRERDATTLAAGHVTVRITYERMLARPHEEAARLHEILRQRRATRPEGRAA